MRVYAGDYATYVATVEEYKVGLARQKKAQDLKKEKLQEFYCPLAEILPHHVTTFIVDANGTFYLRLEQEEVVHLPDFDIVLSEEMSGVLEEDYAYNLNGIKGLAQVQNSVIEFNINEFNVDRTNVTMVTDHPVARVVTVHMDQFIFAIMTSYRPEE